MADQKKWFKVWNSILTDPSFLDLPVEQIGRWTLLGALISLHGENGQITLSKDSLCRLLRVQNDNGMMLPNVEFKRVESDNGTITVIMKNWSKYQLDSTGYERLKRFRKAHNDNGAREDKTKRREDKDKEKTKKVFVPPTIEEVSLYCSDRKSAVNPQKWMAYYESNGWRVGKNPMKDWKAAIRTWESNSGGLFNGTDQGNGRGAYRESKGKSTKYAHLTTTIGGEPETQE